MTAPPADHVCVAGEADQGDRQQVRRRAARAHDRPRGGAVAGHGQHLADVGRVAHGRVGAVIEVVEVGVGFAAADDAIEHDLVAGPDLRKQVVGAGRERRADRGGLAIARVPEVDVADGAGLRGEHDLARRAGRVERLVPGLDRADVTADLDAGGADADANTGRLRRHRRRA